MQLFPTLDVRIGLVRPPAAFVRKLEAATIRTPWHGSRFSHHLVGDASMGYIRMRSVSALIRTGFGPVFTGRVGIERNAVVGRFELPWAAKVVPMMFALTAWAGALGMFFIPQPENGLGMANGVQFFVLGLVWVAVPRVQWFLTKSDSEEMGRTLRLAAGIGVSPEILELERVHVLCMRHRDAVEASSLCGCFHCEETFVSSEIVDWIEDGPNRSSQTALCPRCGIDAVLPEGLGVSVEKEFLSEMNAYWF